MNWMVHSRVRIISRDQDRHHINQWLSMTTDKRVIDDAVPVLFAGITRAIVHQRVFTTTGIFCGILDSMKETFCCIIHHHISHKLNVVVVLKIYYYLELN